MSHDPSPHSGAFRRLPSSECWRLLREQSVGRIAVNAAGGPMVVPVNYAVQDGALWLRTASHTELAARLPDQAVSMEIDHIDLHDRSGWSVLARGHAEHVLHEQASAPAALGAAPWPEGLRHTLFRIEVSRLSGRAVGGLVPPGDVEGVADELQRHAMAGGVHSRPAW